MKQLATPVLLVGVVGSAVALSPASVLADHNSDDFCPKLYEKGVVSLDFNAAFLSVDEFGDSSDPKEGLTVTSFFNKGPDARPDLVALIPDVANLDLNDFDQDTDLQFLTPSTGSSQIIWPNGATRVPDDVGLPFEGIVIPQGFHPAAAPGRLTIVDVDTLTEYVVHQSTQLPGPWIPNNPADEPRFYHNVEYFDMDNDGLKDIVTVRSGFRVGPHPPYPPISELVYFKNPGANVDPFVQWDEVVLYNGEPTPPFVPAPYTGLGPDIHLSAADLNDDGVPELVGTHFFTGDLDAPPNSPPTEGKISIYGAPTVNGVTSWDNVNLGPFGTQLPLRADISIDQGFPFDLEFVDLNKDGKLDILATNHQPDQCLPFTSSNVPGRVYALEQPADGNLYQAWTAHVLKDDILPNPTPGARQPPGRLAPGKAKAFWPKLKDKDLAKKENRKDIKDKPWIVVGGDEASKVWVLRPVSKDEDSWDYESAVIFDINEFYGPGATQIADENGVTISTIGAVAVRYADEGKKKGKGKKKDKKKKAYAEIYIPVFEGQDIHVLSFKKPGRHARRVECTADGALECPVAGPPPF